jgi:hypothetical protein
MNIDIDIPMPISFAFSWAASEAILAASRERVGRLFVADMVAVLGYICLGLGLAYQRLGVVG